MKGEIAMLDSHRSERTSLVEIWEVDVKHDSEKRVWKPLNKKIHRVHKLAADRLLEKRYERPHQTKIPQLTN
jgi:hypothetical protein